MDQIQTEIGLVAGVYRLLCISSRFVKYIHAAAKLLHGYHRLISTDNKILTENEYYRFYVD